MNFPFNHFVINCFSKKLRYIDVILALNITFYLLFVLNPVYSQDLPVIPERPSLKELKSSLGYVTKKEDNSRQKDNNSSQRINKNQNVKLRGFSKGNSTNKKLQELE